MLKLAKLTTREFVIGRLSQNLLINIFIINFKTDNLSGSIGINLIPYMAPLDNSLSPVIGLDKTICLIDPSPELTQQYILATSKFINEMKKDLENNTNTTTNDNVIPISEKEKSDDSNS